MANDKRTEREMFELIKTLAPENEEVIKFADKKIADIDKRNASAKARRAEKAAAPDPVYDAVLAALGTEGKPLAVIGEGIDATPAVITAKLTKMVNAGLVTREDGKVQDADGKKRTVKFYKLA